MQMKKEETIKDIVITGLIFVFGTFCTALCYNLFLLPNNFVIGGVSGVGIILQKITGIDSVIFIYILNILLLLICYLLLGKEEGRNTLVGTLLYPLMITLTAPIANFIIANVEISELLLIALMAGLLNGLGNGLVYSRGYSLGGSDVLVRLASKYLHFSEGKGTFIISVAIIFVGGLIFDFTNAIYATIILYVTSFIIDKVMFGISNSKTFYVFTHKSHVVKRTILREFESGFTVLPTKGGYSHQNGMLIMCVLPNRDYYRFKKRIMEIDPKAFFVIMDCYESHGGYRKKNVPFI